MPLVRVSTKGQIVIPQRIRDELGIKAGTYVRIEREGHDARLTVAGDDVIEATYGMLRDYGTESLTAELLRERALDNEREERKLERLLSKKREPATQRK